MNCVSTFVVPLGAIAKRAENGCKKLNAIYCFQVVISRLTLWTRFFIFYDSFTMYTFSSVFGRHKIADCKFVLSL